MLEFVIDSDNKHLKNFQPINLSFNFYVNYSSLDSRRQSSDKINLVTEGIWFKIVLR